jgi:hypothetical protein
MRPIFANVKLAEDEFSQDRAVHSSPSVQLIIDGFITVSRKYNDDVNLFPNSILWRLLCSSVENYSCKTIEIAIDQLTALEGHDLFNSLLRESMNHWSENSITSKASTILLSWCLSRSDQSIVQQAVLNFSVGERNILLGKFFRALSHRIDPQLLNTHLPTLTALFKPL